LTDHDGVSGLAAARAKAESEGIRFVDGVEISVTWEGSTVHIVGLRIDPENPVLLSGLESIREGRATRAEKMGEALAAAGVPDSLAGAKVYAENPSLISRSHFARHLVKTGRAPDVKSVFQRYLVKASPASSPTAGPPSVTAVSWIRASGGIAVVAHPGRYNFSKPEPARVSRGVQGLRGRRHRGRDRKPFTGAILRIRPHRARIRLHRFARLRLSRQGREQGRSRRAASAAR